jgi:DNA polymerase-3 subunit delta
MNFFLPARNPARSSPAGSRSRFAAPTQVEFNSMDSLTFLERLDKHKPRALYVLHGDEPFLKRLVQQAIRQVVLGPGDDGFGLAVHSGDKAALADVVSDLETLPFLSPRRLVVVENADPFVSLERARLEKLLPELAGRTKSTGVLVLDVQTWSSATRLAKSIPDDSVIVCKAPAARDLPAWCAQRCQSTHGKVLAAAAARLLVTLVGPQMGLLDQELEKLAVYVGSAPRIEVRDVDQLVGCSTAENTFRVFDLIGEGKAGEALTFVDRLLEQGKEPLGLLAAFGWQLRRLAQAARLNAQGTPLADAMTRAGISTQPFARRSAEQQLRHLGRRRLDQLYNWLLETDLGLKGGSQLPPRTLLERFVLRLARPRT